MSYSDPSNIRKHRVTINLNDAEAALVQAINDYHGQQKSALLREMLIESAHRVLAGESNTRATRPESEGAQFALFGS